MLFIGKILSATLLINIILRQYVMGQTETYAITPALFSSDSFDEFSPVFYKNSIVFCTNRSQSTILNYSGSENVGQIKIYSVDTTVTADLKKVKLFSKNLTTKLNDGPVTFNAPGDTIYFSRNLETTGKLSGISGKRNKLGLFYAVLENGQWSKIREFRMNNEWYNVTMPCLTPDGERILFASDKPGGFGGLDLYFSQRKGDFWSDPVNLGSGINTGGNESYPFINPDGDLFFSSDSLPGYGRKDIFFSRYSDNQWMIPVCLDPPVNSEFDDFGIVTDTLMNKGYFSSNRSKSIDIYQFKTIHPQVFYNSIQRDNQHCFLFSDSGSIAVDTALLKYKWSFGDGESSYTAVSNHCYKVEGKYDVALDIIDRITGKVFFSKLSLNLEIRDFEQPYINSSDILVKGTKENFDGIECNLPGFKIISYSWDFGDGTRASGQNVSHSYTMEGGYIVNLVVVVKSVNAGSVHKKGISKKVSVLRDIAGRDIYLKRKNSEEKNLPDFRVSDNTNILMKYSAEAELRNDAEFAVALLSSGVKTDLNSTFFRNLPNNYIIKEKIDQNNGTYHYIIDLQMNLMATYPAFREMIISGFQDAKAEIISIKEPAEKDLHNIVKEYSSLSESYFDDSDMLTTDAYIMLDEIVKLMTKYPAIKLEVAVHTDNTGSIENSLELTQIRSQSIVNYLINRGIQTNRLTAKGYGESNPVAPNFLRKDRRLNQRIGFSID